MHFPFSINKEINVDRQCLPVPSLRMRLATRREGSMGYADVGISRKTSKHFVHGALPTRVYGVRDIGFANQYEYQYQI